MQQEKKTLCLQSFLYVFGWGLAAHAYCFLHSSFAHDALAEFDGSQFGNIWQIQLGRVGIPLYRWIFRSSLTPPLLIGLLSLLWISLALWLFADLFRIKNRMLLFLTAGVLTTNSTMIMQAATYINWMDQNMFAMLLAVLAVWLWKKGGRWNLVLGAVCIGVSLSIYQSYSAVAMALVLMILILDLLNGEHSASILRRGFIALAMMLGGAVVYLAEVKLALCISGQQLVMTGNSVNSLLQGGTSIGALVRDLISGWILSCKTMVCLPTAYTWLKIGRLPRILLLLTAAAVLFCAVLDRKIRVREKVLLFFLALSLPLAMNAAHVLAHGVSHGLMYYAIWLIYPFALLLVQWLIPRYQARLRPCIQKGVRLVPMLALLVILLDNVQVSNLIHLNREMESRATMGFYNRVLTRMEMQPDYIPQETPVIFIGCPDTQIEKLESLAPLQQMTGLNLPVIPNSETKFIRAYFKYMLRAPVLLDETGWEEAQTCEQAKEMPCYPAEDCMQMYHGTLLVKLGETA